MDVSIIGTGYVGLVSGACLAEKGHIVTCVDVDAGKVDRINRGLPPIYEAGLENLLKQNIGRRLRAVTDLRQAVLDSRISIIAVGTPFDGDAIDLSYIREAARAIGTVLRDKQDYHLVVVKSTVVPGTTDGMVLSTLEEASGKQAGRDFGVGMNPEFLREGDAIGDFMAPDRIVLGGIDARSIAVLRELYAVFEPVEIVETSCKTAEMIKYAANSLLATLISFANEMGNLCSAVGGIDIVDVMRGVHLDRRFTPILASGERIVPSFTTYLEAGCGFGGSCFPKDVNALRAYGTEKGQPMMLLDSVMSVNSLQYRQVMTRLYKHFPSLRGVRVAVLGLAFKPGTDDVRESPALPIVRELLESAAVVRAFDPAASEEMRAIFPDHVIEYCETLESAIRDVRAVLLLTRWPQFSGLPGLLDRMQDPPIVIDGRRMLDRRRIARYEGIGL